MIIYMTHPVHGAKVAINELEAIYDESNGWMRYDPTTPAKAEVSDEEVKKPVVNEMAEPLQRGRRRATQED